MFKLILNLLFYYDFQSLECIQLALNTKPVFRLISDIILVANQRTGQPTKYHSFLINQLPNQLPDYVTNYPTNIL
jgi:hypothetical protein